MWLDQLIKAHGLRCAGGNFEECGLDSSKCKKRSGYYLNSSWDKCPVRAVLDDEKIMAALKMERLAKIAPLSNWPDGYSAWLPELVCAIRDARDDRVANERR